MLEYFVHIETSDPPADLLIVGADIPNSVTRLEIPSTELPPDWRQTPAPSSLAAIGDDFVQRGEPAILIVPSALAPSEANWLINPAHRDFSEIRIQPPEPFDYDSRFFR
jgi:RES domain-containing protein